MNICVRVCFVTSGSSLVSTYMAASQLFNSSIFNNIQGDYDCDEILNTETCLYDLGDCCLPGVSSFHFGNPWQTFEATFYFLGHDPGPAFLTKEQYKMGRIWNSTLVNPDGTIGNYTRLWYDNIHSHDCHLTGKRHRRVNEPDLNFTRWNNGFRPDTNWTLTYKHREYPTFGEDNDGNFDFRKQKE